VDRANTVRVAPITPALYRCCGIGNHRRTPHVDERLPVDAQISVVLQILRQMRDEGDVIVGAVVLRDQNVIAVAGPCPAPVVIGPAQTKFKIDIWIVGEVSDRRFEQRLAAEPVKIKAEGVDTSRLRHRRLLLLNLRQTQIVEAEIGRQTRLIMTDELRPRTRHVCPFGEAFAPPSVVFLDRIELR